jgi:hypothetical protein
MADSRTLVVWALLLVAGCGSSSPSRDAGTACTPGVSDACTCSTGAIGAQICAANGSGYGPCDCFTSVVAGSDGSASGADGATQAEAGLDGTTSKSETGLDASNVCGPSNCAGCCWSDPEYPQGTPLQCLTGGMGQDLCGNHGAACTSCLIELDAQGACDPANSTDYSQGGVCVAAPAPTCQSTCGGCCDSTGTCHAVENDGTGHVLDFCGLKGASCYVCDCTANDAGYYGEAGFRYLGDAGGPFANCGYSPGEMPCSCSVFTNCASAADCGSQQ